MLAPFFVFAGTPPGSFLPRPALTAAQVAAQAGASPSVARRYAAFFGQPGARVAAWMRRSLRPGTLAAAGRFTVYRVHANQLVYPTVQTLAKGTPVFTLSDGRPALLRGSGDPIRPFQTAVEVVPAPAPPPQPDVIVPAQTETVVPQTH